MEKLDPCFACDGEVKLHPQPGVPGRFEARCEKCDCFVDQIEGPEDAAVRHYNAVARSPL